MKYYRVLSTEASREYVYVLIASTINLPYKLLLDSSQCYTVVKVNKIDLLTTLDGLDCQRLNDWAASSRQLY